MITSDTKIYSKSEDGDAKLNKWEQLADLMLKEGIIEDIINFADQLLPKLNAAFGEDSTIQNLNLKEWEQLYFRWQNLQIESNPQVEKLNRGQFYIGLHRGESETGSFNESGIFYVNPLSREEWESNSDVGLIYLGVEPVALICEDDTKNKGKDMTERTSLLDELDVAKRLGYNSTLDDVTILNEPEGDDSWSMGYDQSWFERDGWEFHPVSFEVETQRQLGVFNWWW